MKNDKLPGMSIKEWCDLNNMSFNELSKLIPCSQPYIGMMDSNKSTPSYNMACRIEQITNGLVPRTRWYPDKIELIGVNKEDYNYDMLKDFLSEKN